MHLRSLALVPDHVLLQELDALVSNDRAITAALLAHLGECDARKLFRPQGYPSMHAYCVGALRFSDDTAFKRIRVARAARRFPGILAAIADGRLNVSGVVLLAPVLTDKTAPALLAVAENKTKAEIEMLVARCAPKPDVPTVLKPLQPQARELAPGPVVPSNVAEQSWCTEPLVMAMPAVAPAAVPTGKLRPLSPECFAFQVTLSQQTHDLMKAAQDAVGSAIPFQDYDALLCAAFKALFAQKRHERFAETSKPRACRSSSHTRYVSADIKRQVYERDSGQCAFVSDSGKRCECKRDLEYDHVMPVAKGGHTTVDNLRLLCRAHNQFEAERLFGSGFMREKRGRIADPAAPANIASQTFGSPTTSGTPGTRT